MTLIALVLVWVVAVPALVLLVGARLAPERRVAAPASGRRAARAGAHAPRRRVVSQSHAALGGLRELDDTFLAAAGLERPSVRLVQRATCRRSGSRVARPLTARRPA
jgi:hypothetical protein